DAIANAGGLLDQQNLHALLGHLSGAGQTYDPRSQHYAIDIVCHESGPYWRVKAKGVVYSRHAAVVRWGRCNTLSRQGWGQVKVARRVDQGLMGAACAVGDFTDKDQVVACLMHGIRLALEPGTATLVVQHWQAVRGAFGGVIAKALGLFAPGKTLGQR